MGETINVMTLGGLALAVGILVDDATVEIENTHRNLDTSERFARACDFGQRQPSCHARACFDVGHLYCVLAGAAAHGRGEVLVYAFSEAVVFAMLASYFLSRARWCQP